MHKSVFILFLLLVSSLSCLADTVLHEGDWALPSESVDPDTQEYGREEFKDLTEWKKIDNAKWTSFGDWKKQRAAKDKLPSWRTLTRNAKSREIIARVIKCVGRCQYYRGLNVSTAQTLTTLREGDEFITAKDSQAWIVLMDGTIFRVSAKTSLTLNEVNLSLKQVSFLIRLNSGHVQFQSRLRGQFKTLNRPESDLVFSPLLVRQANREFYAINEYKKLSKKEKFSYAVAANAGHAAQYLKLNDFLKSKDDVFSKRDSKVLLYTANLSLFTQNTHGSLFYSPRGKSVFKITNELENFTSGDNRVQRARIQKRGYEVSGLDNIIFNQWYEVDAKGENIDTLSLAPRYFEASRSFLNRIPMIQLAREVFLEKYSLGLFSTKGTKSLARDYGYRLWDNSKRPELFLREAYLKEYIRRTETTNLKSFEKLSEILTPFEFDRSYFQRAMNKHYKKIKDLHSLKNLKVRKLSHKKFYLWLLRENNE